MSLLKFHKTSDLNGFALLRQKNKYLIPAIIPPKIRVAKSAELFASNVFFKVIGILRIKFKILVQTNLAMSEKKPQVVGKKQDRSG